MVRFSTLKLVASLVVCVTFSAGAGYGGLAGDQAAPEVQPTAVAPPSAALADVAAAQLAVESVMGMPNHAGQWLLPPGTTVEDVRWDNHVAEIDLALPPLPGNWYLSDIDVEALSAVLAGPFFHDPSFAGTNVRARVGDSRTYDSLSQFLPYRAEPAPQPRGEPAEAALSLEEAAALAPPVRGQTFGPYTQAAHQPTGALTGVSIFASGGHGWTADTGVGNWYLQREVMQSMNEDHGNIDMLNIFAAYAFNAGATVVPFRPVGWQPIEIVLDNDDPGVTYVGSWSNGSSSKYYENGVTNSGIPYKFASASTTETATARYTPTITVTDYYPVYCFTIASSNRTMQTYRVSHAGGISEVKVDHRQVGNGWIWLGNYYLAAGGNNYVEITNQSTDAGVVVADAIRWGCGMGDIVGNGASTVSGYSRDEECSKYWAQSELGNHAVGFDSNIWHVSGQSDTDDNVRTAAKWAAEMNQVPTGGVLVERWKRIYIEFHTNATGGGARGEMCLITTLGATTYQTEYATTLSNEVDADMVAQNAQWEYAWYDRSAPTYTSAYGAICTPANGDEFDATIIEEAFHDDPTDAPLLRDDRVRAALGKATVQGITRFLHSLSGSTVPLAFAPDTPRDFRVLDAGSGNVTLAWAAPITDAAHGDPATGYVVYQSTDGRAFGSPIVLGNVLTTTISGIPVAETHYYQVAATNAGGESMPSAVLAVRRPADGQSNILIVNGFDRLRRQQNPIETFTHPPAYAGLSIERQQWRKSNAYNYVIQHGDALAANGYGFSSANHDAVIDSAVPLTDYMYVDWILGNESSEDATLTATEQSLLTTFLSNRRGVFITGSDLAYDLVGLSHGTAFCQNTLKVGYSTNDANTYQVSADPNGIFAGVSAFDFLPANGAPYDAYAPDIITARTGARRCVNYVGGGGGIAGVQYYGGAYNAVTFGFPFECITSATARAQIMQKVITFLQTAAGLLPFDYDHDGDVDLVDFNIFNACFLGPDNDYAAGHICLAEDSDGDMDVDLADFAAFQRTFTGPHP